MQPLDYLKTAEVLLASCKGKPSQASLCRAVSSAYYSMFHCLAKTCADLLMGGVGATKSEEAWRQTYRALDHGIAKAACKHTAIISLFPKSIEDFANAFVGLQEKRHTADYDPKAKFTKSEVKADVALAKQAIADFSAEVIKDRRAFAAHVLFKRRPG